MHEQFFFFFFFKHFKYREIFNLKINIFLLKKFYKKQIKNCNREISLLFFLIETYIFDGYKRELIQNFFLSNMDFKNDNFLIVYFKKDKNKDFL